MPTAPVPPVRQLLGSWLRADFSRGMSVESRITVAVWRLGNAGYIGRGPLARLCVAAHVLLDTVWTRAVIGAELPRAVVPGPGLRLQHAGRGIVVNPSVTIGSGVSIFHRVTLGTRGGTAAPDIGNNVGLGVDCAVLGGVHIGADSRIGAKALVTRDVPAGSTVRGALGIVSTPE